MCSHCSVMALLLAFIMTAAYSELRVKIPSTATAIQPCSSVDGIPMEHARIHFHTNVTHVYAYGISTECYECLYLPLDPNPLDDSELCILIDTRHPFTIGYSKQIPFSGCPVEHNTCAWQPDQWLIPPSSYHYHQYAHYSIHVHQTKSTTTILQTAPNKYIPLYIAMCSILGLIICYNIYTKYLKRRSHYNDKIEVSDSSKQRFISLDAFRGLSLIIMIFVNYGGGGYWWLSHSSWNGLTIADLVFPWFIFNMGFAMAIVFPRKLQQISANPASHAPLNHPVHQTTQITRCALMRKVLFRSIHLFIIGLFIISNAHDLEYMRIPGVLQYFAISYCVNSVIIICTEPLQELHRRRVPCISNLYCPEIVMYWKQWLVILCLICAYVILVFAVPFTIYDETCPTGYIGPGGIGDKGKYIECTGGIHRYMDLKLFGENHVYQSPTVRGYYATGWYDPEGIMGAWTATILTFFGVFIGRILTVYRTHKQRIIRWFMYAVVFGLIAGILCGFKQNGGWIPVNKNMWSLSFICCQASTGIFLLIVFYILIDVTNIWSGIPFHWLGCNSIIIYTGSEVFGSHFPWSFSYGDMDHYKLLLSNIIGISLWIAFAGYLYHKKTFFAL
eukprot:217212_1